MLVWSYMFLYSTPAHQYFFLHILQSRPTYLLLLATHNITFIPEVAGSSLARSQCPYGSGFTPRLRLAGWRSARWDHLGGWEDRGISPPSPPNITFIHTYIYDTCHHYSPCQQPHRMSRQM
ncbi:hypothetical protein Hanom_Chr12g01072951 [Helianthus anomalus]